MGIEDVETWHITEDREVCLQKQPTKVLCFLEDLERVRRILLVGPSLNISEEQREEVRWRMEALNDLIEGRGK